MVTVRPTTPADVDAVFDLHVASIHVFGPAAYDEAQVEAWATTDEPEYPIGDDDHRVVVAERGDEIAGSGDLHRSDAEVTAVYVHPDHARRGVGAAILAALEVTARKRGIDELALLAPRNAVLFYEAAGYERVKIRIHETCGEELECAWMRKPL